MMQDDLDPTSPLSRRGVLMQQGLSIVKLADLPGSWVWVPSRGGGPLDLGEEVGIGILFPVVFMDPTPPGDLPDLIAIGNQLMPQGWIVDGNAEEVRAGQVPVIHRDGHHGVLVYRVNEATQDAAADTAGDPNP